jgi:hypothetical protein
METTPAWTLNSIGKTLPGAISTRVGLLDSPWTGTAQLLPTLTLPEEWVTICVGHVKSTPTSLLRMRQLQPTTVLRVDKSPVGLPTASRFWPDVNESIHDIIGPSRTA